MIRPRSLLLLVTSLAIAACGANAAELKRAREARYHGDPAALAQAAAGAAQAENYKIAKIDPDTGAFLTVRKIFGPEGDLESAGSGNTVQIRDRSIAIEFLVKLVPAEATDTFALSIEPNLHRIFVDRSNTDELSADDPSLPGWVHGRIDDLTIALHDALASYEVKATAP